MAQIVLEQPGHFGGSFAMRHCRLPLAQRQMQVGQRHQRRVLGLAVARLLGKRLRAQPFLQGLAGIAVELQNARHEGAALRLACRHGEVTVDLDGTCRGDDGFVEGTCLLRASGQPELGVGLGAAVTLGADP